MDMIKCPVCGEMYSSSYRRCPFCEEDGDDGRKIRYAPKRRIADRQQARSARGGLIVVLVLVLCLLSWYLFGDKILPRADAPAEPTIAPPSQTEPAAPASNPDAEDPFYQEPTEPAEPITPAEPAEPTEPAVPAEPPDDENVDVSNAKLNRSDFTLSHAGEKFTLRVSGTEATPHWSIDNANVATLMGDGTVTAVANGSTTIRCKVGARELTCIVRVTNTGKSAAPASEPTAAVAPTKPETPPSTAPSTPSTPSTPETPGTPSGGASQTVSGSLRIKTNVTGELPKDPDTKTYDCTVHSGNPDSLRLIVYDDNGKELSASWSSADTNVAKIADDGRITTVGRGRTTVTATVGGATVKCIIRVN